VRGGLDALGFWMTRTDRSGTLLWFGLSLLVAAYGGGVALSEAFAGADVIQDDARQHVVWALRFLDPALFPNDPIADYFRTLAPAGYASVYRAAAALGLDPVLLSKLLPVALGLILAGFGFALGSRLAGAPAAGFLVSWTLSENAWLMDNVASATPRAFLYPLFAAFLFYLLKRSGWGVVVTVLLLGLTYPQMALTAGGLAGLSLFTFHRGLPRLSGDHGNARVATFGVAAAIVVLAPYAMQGAIYGPTISPAAARGLAEFWVGERAAFFDPDPWRYWSCGERSGLLPLEWCQMRDRGWAGIPATLAPLAFLVLILALPIMLHARAAGPVAARIGSGITILPRLLLVSVALYAAAHVVLFQLHLPNRYSQHSIRFAFDIAFGLCLYLLVLKALYWARGRDWGTRAAGRVVVVLTVALVVAMPVVSAQVGERLYVTGGHPALYAHLAAAPKNTVVATLEDEGDNLPAFARRSVLFAREFAIPYQTGYYTAFRERGRRTAEAQYAADPAVLARFLDDFGIDYWLVDEGAFDRPQIVAAWWARQFPTAYQAALSGKTGALATLAPLCVALRDPPLVLLDAKCLRAGLGQ